MRELTDLERMNLEAELKAEAKARVRKDGTRLVSTVDDEHPGKSLDVPVEEPAVGLTFHSPGKSILPLSAEARAFWDNVQGLPFN